MSSTNITAPGLCSKPPPKKMNSRICMNQPSRIDNFGTGCGGVGALSPAVKRAQQKRAGGFSRSDDVTKCPDCTVGASNIGPDGKASCNPSILTRKQERDTFSNMFPRSQFPMIYIKRRFNYPVRRRI